MDAHALFCGKCRGQQWIEFAAVVRAIGNQDQHAAVGRALAQALDGKADGIADGGIAARDADPRLVQPDTHGTSVEGQRRLQVGLAAEEDQTDPIAVALLDEVAEQHLDQLQSGELLALPLHVRVIHRAGDIHCEQQVAATGGQWQRLAQPLWRAAANSSNSQTVR